MNKIFLNLSLRSIGLFFSIFTILSIPIASLAFEGTEITDPIINPSAAYCEGLGYTFIIVQTSEGEDAVCRFSDGNESPAWEFLRGEQAQEYSYCSKSGYKMKVVDDGEVCGLAYKPNFGCLVCVLADGSQMEVSNLFMKDEATKLMGIDKPTQICKIDGKCLSGEDDKNCPSDCVLKEVPNNYFVIFVVIIFIIAIAGIGAMLIIKRKKE